MKNIGKFDVYDFLAILLKLYWLSFEKHFEALAAHGSCNMTSSRQRLNKNLRFSEVFRACLKFVPDIHFHEMLHDVELTFITKNFELLNFGHFNLVH